MRREEGAVVTGNPGRGLPDGARRGGRTRFGRLLLLILAVYVVVIAFNATRLSGVIRAALLGLILVVAARLRGPGRVWTSLAAGAAVAALATSVVALRLGSPRLAVALTSVAVLLVVMASMAAIGRLLWHRPVVDAQTVAGALSVYLLLALLFATLHQMLGALLGPPYLNGVPGYVEGARYLYFSVITLATVGYGDITPACDAARAVAMAEALFGQLYLVAVVGAVVSNATSRRTGVSRCSGPR